MQPGDIFKLDDDAILDMENEEFSVVWKDKAKNEHRLEAGAQFRITTKDGISGLPIEVRASKINPVTGKCGRGRPRRFPAAVVYRLLGETAPDPTTLVVPAVTADMVVPTVVQTLQDEVVALAEEVVDEPSEEELEAQRARVASLIGLIDDNGDDNDW